MKNFLLFLLLTCTYSISYSQVETPFSFISEDENRLIKEEDSGKYFVASGDDTSRLVFLNEEGFTYRLLDKEHKLLAEGNFSIEGEKYLREGKWVEYFENGKVKNSGHYYKNNPVGTWHRFYPNGKPCIICNYVLVENGSNYYCLAGTYQDYYENGQVKTNGLYKATIDDLSKDTTYVINPVTDQKEMKVVRGKSPRPEKFGTWEHFNEKGELIKKEEL